MKAATYNISASSASKTVFQSTPPVKAATVTDFTPATGVFISIHAAREGGDFTDDGFISGDTKFQSTPPVKAATKMNELTNHDLKFQSTPPVKAATQR